MVYIVTDCSSEGLGQGIGRWLGGWTQFTSRRARESTRRIFEHLDGRLEPIGRHLEDFELGPCAAGDGGRLVSSAPSMPLAGPNRHARSRCPLTNERGLGQA